MSGERLYCAHTTTGTGAYAREQKHDRLHGRKVVMVSAQKRVCHGSASVFVESRSGACLGGGMLAKPDDLPVQSSPVGKIAARHADNMDAWMLPVGPCP